MSDKNNIDKIGLINLPNVPDSVDNALKNLTDQPTHSIGTTLGDIWFMVFGGISHAADKRRLKYTADLDEYRAELELKNSSIPAEKKMEPSIQVTAQALEDSKYCVQEPELRKMFVSLISNSMNADYANDVHPSFSGIIKQMSVVDAQILSLFKSNPLCSFPICEFHLPCDGGSYKSLVENVFLEISFPDVNIAAKSLASLNRFGLLLISTNEHLVDKSQYDKFEQSIFYHLCKQRFNCSELHLHKGLIKLTPLGRSFVKVCIPD